MFRLTENPITNIQGMLSESANKRLNLLKRAIKLYLARREQYDEILRESLDNWITLVGLPLKVEETWTESDYEGTTQFILLTIYEDDEEGPEYVSGMQFRWSFLIK